MAVIGILAAIAIPMFDVNSYESCDRPQDLNGAPGIQWGVAAGNAGMVANGDDAYFAYAVSRSKRPNGMNHIYIWEKQADGPSLQRCLTDDPPNHGGCQNSGW